jgi:hypothetical protein
VEPQLQTRQRKNRDRTAAPIRLAAGLLTGLLALTACHGNDQSAGTTAVARPAPAPVRGAAGDEDLRIMLAQLASAKACEQIHGHFQALPASGRPDVMAGVLWIHGCRITNTGTKVKFRLEGNGWQWIDQEKKKAGATFSMRQYVRFAVAATISGTLDVGYDPTAHIASVWFSPTGDPEVRFAPTGNLDVDPEGAWSSVLGAAASLLAKSPEESAQQDAQNQGAAEFKKQFAGGLSITADLCTGLVRTGMGHTTRGKMAAPGVGETSRIAVELQPGGLMIFGPQPATDGMTIEADVPKGAAHLALMCNDQAQAQAKAFVASSAPPAAAGSVLAAHDVHGQATLQIAATKCPVSLVATLPADATEAVSLTWRRPAVQTAESNGGPVIDCPETAARAAR